MNELTDADLRKIIARRDRRFDGRFFFGVRTTGIYCRPVCPARPKAENIVIFRSLSEAEKSGFRPCRRCHPDAAPGSRFLEGTSNTVSRALRLIDDTSEDLTIDRLAEVLGLTDRHLRRLFEEHLGASPIEIMITKRLHFAKKLLLETNRSIAEIAFASGFRSIRRFNEVFRNSYHQTPSEIRQATIPLSADGLTLRLPLHEPYDWKSVLAYLKRHEVGGLENIDEDTYRRFIAIGSSFGTIEVKKGTQPGFLQVRLYEVPLTMIRPLMSRLRHLFDTDHNPRHLPASARSSTPGIRVPGCFDPFETAVSIVLSQLVSTPQARASLWSLVHRFGREIDTGHARQVFEFPSPDRLKNAPFEEIGLPRIKSQALRDLSAQVLMGHVDFGPASDPSVAATRLLEIRGIGPWTVSMIAMRCFQDPDAFPDGDLIVRRALDEGHARPNDWTSMRAYLVHSLWQNSKSPRARSERKKK